MSNQKTKVLYPKAGKPSTKQGKSSGIKRTTFVKTSSKKK